MVNTFVKFCVLAACASSALGHGKLLQPLGFAIEDKVSTVDCRRFTAEQPCGMGVDIPYPENVPTYQSGQVATMLWRVANIDGAGPMRAYMDVSGTGKSFNTPLRLSGGPGGILGVGPRGWYNLGVQMPVTPRCQGPEGTCLIRVMSGSGFASCAWVRVANPMRKRSEIDQAEEKEGLEKRQLTLASNQKPPPVYLRQAGALFNGRTNYIPNYRGPELDGIGTGDTVLDTVRDPIGNVYNTAAGVFRSLGSYVPGGNEAVGRVLRPINFNGLPNRPVARYADPRKMEQQMMQLRRQQAMQMQQQQMARARAQQRP